MVGFALAVVTGQWIGVELGLERAGWICVAAWGVWLVAARRAARLELVARGLAGILWGGVTAAVALATPQAPCWLPPEDAVVKRWIEAEVRDPPVPGPATFRVGVRATLVGGEEVCGTLSLSIAEPPTHGLGFGDRFRAHARLRRPRDFANPGAFAYVESLHRRDVWAVGGTRTIVLIGERAPRSGLEAVRARVRESILTASSGAEAALLRALVLGESGVVEAATWETLSASGLAHLVSISGLHIAAVWAVFAFTLIGALGRSELLLLRTDVRALAALLALGPALAYVILAGGSIPAERALALALLVAAATALGRETRPLRLLSIAALALSLLHPGVARSISFQLSFAAVVGLVLALSPRAEKASTRQRRWRRWAVDSLRTTLGATLATAPLVAFYFNRVSPIGLVTNPILVPTLGLPATVLGLIGGATSLVSITASQPLFAAAAALLGALLDGAEVALFIPFASFRVPTPSLLEMAILYGMCLVPWLPRRRSAALVALGVVLAGDVGFWCAQRSGRGDLRVTFVDVGQGDAAIVELPDGRVVVIDGGGLRGTTFDVGERVVARVLWARRIMGIDVLVASHGDHDHQHGLGFLARAFAPRELWTPDSTPEAARLGWLRRTASEAGAALRSLAAGDRIVDRSGVVFECLHPPRFFTGAPNDRSLVLRLRHGRTSWLFPGDVEKVGESRLLSMLGGEPVDVIKVPHHGSATSSHPGLLAIARPKVAVVSAGAANPYGVPRPDVLRRYRRLGTRVFRTDVDGAVSIRSDGQSLEVRPGSAAARSACSALGASC